MLSLEKCREILGPVAKGKSDAQIDQLRGELYMLAGIAIAAFKESRKPGETGK